MSLKLISILLSSFILLANFDFCQEEYTMSAEQIELAQTDDESCDEELPCAPFCQCTRCPFSVIVPAFEKEKSAELPLSDAFTNETSGSPTTVVNSVWQPPKYI